MQFLAECVCIEGEEEEEEKSNSKIQYIGVV